MSTETAKSVNRSSAFEKTGDEIDLFHLLRVVWHRWKLIASVTTAAALLSLVISLVLPKVYSTEASILPVSSDDAASTLMGFASQMGPAVNILGGMGAGHSADLTVVLRSRTMIERVINACHLDKELKGWKYRADLVDRVRKMTTVTPPNFKANVITIDVEAPQAELAAAIANAYVSELKVLLDQMGYNRSKSNRRFIEAQQNNSRDELKKAEDELAQFQAKNHLASLPEAIVSSIRTMSDLEAQRVNAEVQLRATNDTLGVMRGKVESLQLNPEALADVEIKRRALNAQSEALSRAKNDFMGKLSNLPPQAMELARLQRDVQVKTAVYMVLSQQLETARIGEYKDSNDFISLDAAPVPERPSKPRKILITLLGALLGLVAGLIAAFSREWWVSRRALVLS